MCLLLSSGRTSTTNTTKQTRLRSPKNTDKSVSPQIDPAQLLDHTQDRNDNDDKLGQDFLREIQENPENIKQLLEEFINISYRYEKDVKDAKALYEWLIETLPQAIWVYNYDGSFFYRNTRAIEISHIVELIQANPRDSLESTLEIECDKRIFLVQTSSFQNRLLITATDITSQKRQARLASMGQISAHLAHEIRNPIGSMSLLAATLQKSALQSQLPIIDELQKSIFRVERIIKATLLFSKGISANKQPLRICELQDELQAFVKSYSFSKDIAFHYAFADKVAYMDKDLILIALQNFLFNAIDAIEEGDNECGQVVLEGDITQGEVCFLIKDNGKPFDNPNILFEPFVTTKLKGNGLGLALSNHIIQAHSGRIELNAKDKEFRIYLPKVSV